MTMKDFLQNHPVKPIRLYCPKDKDWYGETKRYLYRFKDGCRRVEAMHESVELLDGIADPDEELTRYRDELHQKLKDVEQEMKRVRVEVMELLAALTDADQRSVMTRRYLNGETWKQIAARMQVPISEVQAYHQTALPILKRALKRMNAEHA